MKNKYTMIDHKRKFQIGSNNNTILQQIQFKK